MIKSKSSRRDKFYNFAKTLKMARPFVSLGRIDFVIALVSILMTIGVASLPFKAKPFGDITFHEEAKNLSLYLKGALPLSEVMITKAPGPVVFYTPAYLLAPNEASDDRLWLHGVVFTALLIAVALLLIYRAAALMFSKEIGLLSIILAFAFPIHCYYSLGILAEAPAFFATALALYGWSVASRNPKRTIGWLWMTIGIWLLILNRPNAMLLPLLGFCVLAFAWFKNREFLARFGKPMLFSLSAVLVMGFASLEAAKAVTAGKTDMDQGRYFYYVAHQGRFEFREEPLDFRFWENTIRPDSKDYQDWIKSRRAIHEEAHQRGVSTNEVFREFLINDALEHPFLFVRQFFVKCVYGNLYFVNSIRPEKFHLGPFHGKSGYWLLMSLINAINVLIVVFAVVFIAKEKNRLQYWLLWGSMLALLIFHGITYMEPRYIFPSRAALYILSAAGMYRIAFVRKAVEAIGSRLFPR